MLQLDIGILLGHFDNRAPPEPRAFQDIGLVNRGHLFAPVSSRLEGEVGDTAHFALAINHRIQRLFLAVTRPSFPRRAEVDAAGQLADDEQVSSFKPFRAERAGIEEGRVGDNRPEIGIQPQRLAQPQQPLLRPYFG